MTNILTKSMSVYIIKIITRAVLLCAEQEIALRGHRGQDSSNDVRKKSDTERTMQRNNFFAITNAFAILDVVLMKYLEKSAQNAKTLSWQIQNHIVECLSKLLRSKKKNEILDYYAIIADEITDRFSNKEILLLYLRYVRFFANEKPYNAKYFSILYISKVEQHVRLLEAAFYYCFKEIE